jgi:predicted  nucleic acid-binding Zn-ribbon protein
MNSLALRAEIQHLTQTRTYLSEVLQSYSNTIAKQIQPPTQASLDLFMRMNILTRANQAWLTNYQHLPSCTDADLFNFWQVQRNREHVQMEPPTRAVHVLYEDMQHLLQPPPSSTTPTPLGSVGTNTRQDMASLRTQLASLQQQVETLETRFQPDTWQKSLRKEQERVSNGIRSTLEEQMTGLQKTLRDVQLNQDVLRVTISQLQTRLLNRDEEMRTLQESCKAQEAMWIDKALAIDTFLQEHPPRKVYPTRATKRLQEDNK